MHSWSVNSRKQNSITRDSLPFIAEVFHSLFDITADLIAMVNDNLEAILWAPEEYRNLLSCVVIIPDTLTTTCGIP